MKRGNHLKRWKLLARGVFDEFGIPLWWREREIEWRRGKNHIFKGSPSSTLFLLCVLAGWLLSSSLAREIGKIRKFSQKSFALLEWTNSCSGFRSNFYPVSSCWWVEKWVCSGKLCGLCVHFSMNRGESRDEINLQWMNNERRGRKNNFVFSRCRLFSLLWVW